MNKLIFIIATLLLLNSCAGGFKLPKGGDARKNPPDPKERVKKNLEEGKGFRLDTAFKKNSGTTFEFASSNELWRASLDVIDFMPLVSANYSGGIIITDWYSENQKESIKVTLRFLSNEVRSDSINIKIFYKECQEIMNCKVSERNSELKKELKKQILRKAAIYKKQAKDKDFKPYYPSGSKN
tara:strand:+ start:338 stop:886 length:549 start_codon:yes stop_codon:yes gene_type:complete